jgi:hypothetical protein
MKKILLVLMGIVLLSSCKNEQEKVMDKCEDAFVSKLNDPSSYELISISITDTIRKSNSMEIQAIIVRPYSEPIPVSEGLKSLGDYYYERKKEYTEDSLKYVINKAKYDSIMTEVESLRKNTSMDSAVSYVVEIECRAKNAMGALVVGTSSVVYNVKTGECSVRSKE